MRIEPGGDRTERERERELAPTRLALFIGFCVLGAVAAFAPAEAASPDAQAHCEKTAPPKGADATEQKVWRSVCLAGYAVLSALDEQGCDASGAAQWPIERRVSAGFLKSIYLEEPWRSARRGGALHLKCAVIDGDLDLSHQTLPDALLIEDSRLVGDVTLLGAVAERQLSFRGSWVTGGLDADGMRAAMDVFLRRGVFEGPVRLRGARLRGALEAQGARFDAGLSVEEAEADGPVSLSGAQIAGGAANFTGLRAPSLDLAEAGLPQAEGAYLRAARIGALDVSLGAWLAMRDLRAFKAEAGSYLGAAAPELIGWLEAGFPDGAAYAEERAAYLGLADALGRAGRQGDARDVRIAERLRYLDRGETTGLSAALWRLWGWTAGFGHRPERVLVWLAALIALGAGVGAATARLRRHGGARLIRLSAANALLWPGDAIGRGRLYRGASSVSAFFVLQRLLGAALLAAGAFALLSRVVA